MENSQQKPTGLKNKISELRDIILIVSPVFLCVSFIFNFSYFFALEIQFEKVPLATTDYFITVNSLIPSLITILLFSINSIIGYEPIRKLTFLILKEYKTLPFYKRILTMSPLIVAIIIICYQTYIVLDKKSIFYINAPVTFFALIFIIILLGRHFNIDDISLKHIFKIVILFIAPILSAVYLAERNYTDTTTDIMISGNSYYAMRSFGSGFLLRVPDQNKLVFLTTTGVKINFQQSENFQDKLHPDKMAATKRP